jgi:PAS domain S-box-containing protein
VKDDIYDYFSFFNLAIDLFAISSSEGHFVKINRAFTVALGYEESELLDVPFISFVHPADVRATLAELASLNEGAVTLNFQNRYRCKDGKWKTLAWKAAPQSNGMIYAVARDVTEKAEMDRIVNRSVLRAQDVERQRMSKELHDGVCQSLAAIQLNFHILEPTEEAKQTYYETARSLIKNSIKEMRSYGHTLQPPELVEQNLVPAIRSLAKRTEILSQVEINFDCKLSEDLEMPAESKIHLFRIIQEFINNSLKHSSGTKIDIFCELTGKRGIRIKLSDNGTGLPSDVNDSMRSGTGLANMLARIQLINAKYELQTAPDQGLSMTIELHLPEEGS